MKKFACVLVVLCFVVVFFTVGCCPKNPTLNSVKTAHGNTDWHIDTAEEFLTGKDMGGTTSAANHCPDTWSKTHMHVGLTNTNEYYYDKDVVTAGKDTDLSKGIDKPMLFFYAGHGEPTEFDTLGNDALLTNMRIGNCTGASNKGILRYYWQCSCKVFAHGPKNCTGSTYEYACPEDYDGSADSDAMRNVYERWGAIIDPTLRLACGSSTLAYCHEGEMNKIWDNYNNNGYDVADSFIDGLHRESWNTPLCITTGGFFVSSTPLFDTTFTNAANSSGAYFHIQYLSNFDTTATTIVLIEPPELLYVYELISPPLPGPYRELKFIEKDEWMYSEREVKERGPEIKVNRKSGALYVSGERRFDEKMMPLKEEQYIRLAQDFIKKQGWNEKEISDSFGTRMIIERLPREGKKAEKNKFQKNVSLTFRRQMTINGQTVNFVGAGGMISVKLNNDGTVQNASKVWRKIKDIKRTTKAKKYKRAYEEALQKIKERSAYKLSNWTWGYEEDSGNVEQTELKAVYIFNFLPADPEKFRDYPPRIIKVSAHQE